MKCARVRVTRCALGKKSDATFRLCAAPPDAWIESPLTSPLKSFAKGVAADRSAIAAAIEMSRSNGQTLGQICRLKTLKRQMGGMANVDLLKARMLPAA